MLSNWWNAGNGGSSGDEEPHLNQWRPADTCALPNCGKPVFKDPVTGLKDDYCGPSHATLGRASAPTIPSTFIQRGTPPYLPQNNGVCRYNGCTKAGWVDPSGKISQYCGKTHMILAQQANVLAQSYPPSQPQPPQQQQMGVYNQTVWSSPLSQLPNQHQSAPAQSQPSYNELMSPIPRSSQPLFDPPGGLSVYNQTIWTLQKASSPPPGTPVYNQSVWSPTKTSLPSAVSQQYTSPGQNQSWVQQIHNPSESSYSDDGENPSPYGQTVWSSTPRPSTPSGCSSCPSCAPGSARDEEYSAELRELTLDEHNNTTDRLAELMIRRPLVNLSKQVQIPDISHATHQGPTTVYKGLWSKAKVAIIVTKGSASSDETRQTELTQQFLRELRDWAALDHPNIVRLHGYSMDFGWFPATVSTWCRLGNATQYFSTGDFDLDIRLNLMYDVVHGLHYLHDLGIVHGNLNPQNILIRSGPAAMLCNFGLMSLMKSSGNDETTIKSPYMAPELLITAENPSPRPTVLSDVYSLGCVGLYFLEGQEPYGDTRDPNILCQLIQAGRSPGEVKSSTIQDSDVKETFWELLKVCWNRHNDGQLPKVDSIEATILGLIKRRRSRQERTVTPSLQPPVSAYPKNQAQQPLVEPPSHSGTPNIQGFSTTMMQLSKEVKVLKFHDQNEPYYEFTNFSPHEVVYQGRSYPTSEHAYQAQKFSIARPGLVEHIRTYSDDPHDACDEARRFQPEWRKDWHSVKIQMMDEILREKFTQNPRLRQMLVHTGNAWLIESSPSDSFWGIGTDGKGKNELGLSLMRLRSALQKEDAVHQSNMHA